MAVPPIDLTAQPITRAQAEAIAADGRLGELVGFKYRTRQTGLCNDDCLAPGSSPHSHSVLDGYYLIGTTGYLLVDVRGYGVKSGMIHAFTD